MKNNIMKEKHAQALTAALRWHRTSEELPEKSGRYLILHGHVPYYGIMYVPYSAKYRKFNVVDEEREDETYKFEITADYWAEYSGWPEFNEKGDMICSMRR